MSDPKNHAVEMTEYGIRKMIRDAVQPLREENRKLSFMIGMSASFFAQKADEPYIDILDSWYAMAARNMESMPKEIPTDTIMLAGKAFAESQIEELEEEAEAKRNYPSPEAIAKLEKILDDLHEKLDAWFSLQYGEAFVKQFWGQDKLECFNADLNNDSLLLSFAWNALVKLQMIGETGYDAYAFTARWGSPKE